MHFAAGVGGVLLTALVGIMPPEHAPDGHGLNVLSVPTETVRASVPVVVVVGVHRRDSELVPSAFGL
jgi:hypothetical protein